jgi:DNA recombination protein RmuC
VTGRVTPVADPAAMLMPSLLLLLGLAAGAGLISLLWLRDRETLVAARSRLEAERDAALRDVLAERTRSDESQAQVREAFAALSRSALKENRQDFLDGANSLLVPVRETLDRVQTHLREVDKLREGTFQALSTQLGSLRAEQQQLRSAAEGLSRSLASPNVRGTWGEIQLRRIVELSGMLPHCDFAEKVSATGDHASRQTPDLVIRLPGDATIVVDSKVPITAYRSAMNAATAEEREPLLDAHVRQVRDHMRALGAKEYWKAFQPAPDLVVMFLPLEALLSAAFERDDSLLDLASTARVIPATPMTLLALLKTVAAGWKQQQLARNAEEIQWLGRELYERLATMAGHVQTVGDSLKRAGDSYNSLVGSLEQKVLPGARRFRDLGVPSSKELPDIEPLQLEMRALVKAELTGPRDTDGEDAALARVHQTEH